MTDRVADLEAKVEELSRALADVKARLAVLERSRPRAAVAARSASAALGTSAAAAAGAVGDTAGAAARAAGVPSTAAVFGLVGRTLVVLAGAFVLRALTDSGTLALPLGVALGLAYAGVWIALADRAGKAGAGWSAGFHGATAAMIGFPLLVEATFRFKLLSPAAAAALLAGLTGVALAVAARRRLEGLAWLVSLAGAAAATAVALAPLTGRATFPALYLVALGVATLWIGYVLDWHGPRWPIAIAADVLVAVVSLRALSSSGGEGAGAAFGVQAALMLAYLGSIVARTLLLGRRVVAFEIFQAGAVLAVGLGGAAAVASRVGGGAVAFGAVGAASGLAAYAVAFALVERRPGGSANFGFYASIALALLLAGSGMLLPGAAVPLVWAALGVVAGVLARRSGRFTLSAHASVYAFAAALAAGLLSHAAEVSFASPDRPWDTAGLADVLVLALATATAWLAAGGAPRRRIAERIPQAILVAVVACSASGVAVGWLVPLLAGAPGAGAAPGAVATVRTGVWVAGALVLTWLGRRDAWREAGWLVYPALAAIGLKILLEDLQRSRPATLFLAFALYGGALILVPRFRQRAREAATPSAGSAGG